MKDKTPKHEYIVRANLDLLRGLDKLEFDGDEGDHAGIERLTRTCWACGDEGKERATRAHVVARSHGGSSDPGNFFLLCDRCHYEQPDGMPRESQIRWLAGRELWIKAISRIVDEWLDEMRGLVPGRETILERYLELTRDELISVIHRGYEAGAGLPNRRANARCALIEHFKGWLVNHPDEARARG